MGKKLIILIMISSFFLSVSGCLFPREIDDNKEYAIPLDSIKFKLSEVQDRNYYKIYLVYEKDRKTAEYFGGHYIRVYGSGYEIISSSSHCLYFNPADKTIFLPFAGGKGRYYILGKGRIVNAEFKPDFIEGTTFGYHQRQHPNLDIPAIIIHFPKSGLELMHDPQNVW